MSYYSGSRRFALGGKGWTIVLGTTVSLSYIRARAAYHHQDLSQEYHNAHDHEGNPIKFADQPTVPGKQEDIVIRIWRQLPEVPLPNLYLVGGCFTVVWAYRMWGSFNRLMGVRYADVHYQLRRPDVLANKVVALRYLALPLAVVPVAALGVWAATRTSYPEGETGLLRSRAVLLRSLFAEPCREAGFLLRGVMEPITEELGDTPLAAFGRRSQRVARPGFGDSTAEGPMGPPAPWR